MIQKKLAKYTSYVYDFKINFKIELYMLNTVNRHEKFRNYSEMFQPTTFLQATTDSHSEWSSTADFMLPIQVIICHLQYNRTYN
jgi:hypothetical protein